MALHNEESISAGGSSLHWAYMIAAGQPMQYANKMLSE